MIQKVNLFKLTLLCLVGFLCFNSNGYGQGNTCATATSLGVIGSSCTAVPFDITTAFSDSGVAAPSCVTTPAAAFRDMWYSFTTGPSTTTINANLVTPDLNARRAAFTIYSGSCGTLTEITCRNQTASPQALNANNVAVTPNTTYYMRLMRTNNLGGNNLDGTFCVYQSNGVFTYDDPCGAQPLTINPTCTYTNSNNTGATNTTGVTAPGCASYSGQDVWFSVTVPANGSVSVDLQTGTMTDSGMAFYTGTCSGLTLLECDDDDSPNGAMSYIAATGLTPGSTLFVRVWDYGGGTGTFGICATSPTPATNDDPCTAEPLTIGATCNYATYTNAGASATSGVPAPGCAGYSGSDVWFSVTVPANGNISVDTQTGSMTDSGMALYSAASCSGPFTLIECDDDDSANGLMSSITRTGLTPGSTIYIRVWEFLNDNNGTFGICVTSPTDPCPSAPTLACGATLSGTTVGAANISSTIGCGMGNVGAYYTFVGDGLYNTISSTASFDHEMAIASGSCGTFTNITCQDVGLSGDPESYSFITAVGVTYYVYISDWLTGGTITGTFNISRSCTPTTPPPNDLCSGAIAMGCGDNVAGSTIFATNRPSDTPLCAGDSAYGVWYTFVGTGAQTIITASPLTNYNIRMTVMTGTCGSLANVPTGCFNNEAAGIPEQFVFNSVLGTTYYIYISANTAASTATGSFNLSIDCCDAVIVDTPACTVEAGGLGLDGADPAPINCSAGGCVDLEVEYLQLGNTTSYRVEQIPYSPPTTGFITPITGLTDDYFSTAINFPPALGNFCFYGNSYSNFVYGANGVISFDSARLANSPSGYITDFNIPAAINASFLGNYYFGPSIFGVHHDIDPTQGGIVGYRMGTVNGCQAFILEWQDVPMFDDNSILYSGQMVLFSGTNIIEIYIEEKRIDGTWNDGNASVGIQNNASEGLAAPCRNTLDPNWTVTTGEAWRFIPDAGDITSVVWYEGSGTGGAVVGNGPTISVCPTATTTYTAAVTYSPACGTPFTRTDETVVTVGDKVWNGSVSTNWYLDANWTPVGVPTATDCVVIPDVATTNNRSPIADFVVATGTIPLPPDFTALARNVSVRNNGTLIVNSDTYLEIDEWLNVQPSGDVLIRDSGSLIQLTEGAPNTNNNTGNIRMQRAATGVGSQNYVYWSSPVEGFNVANINTAASELRWEWNPTQGGLNGTWIAASGAMTVGKGYIVRGLAVPPGPIPPDNAEFVGRPSNGILTVPITRGTWTGAPYDAVGGGDTQATNIDDNWNLVGNPYPSAISADDFIATNAAALDGAPMLGTIYLWQRQGGPSASADPFYGDYVYNYLGSNYVAYNPTGPNPPQFLGSIAAGQSFFIQMDDTAGVNANITFNNSMRSRTLANDNFLRTMERHRIWLDLIDPSDAAISSLVGYVQEATNDKDRLFDGHDLSDSNMKFYSFIEDEKMAIQGRMLPFDSEDRVPLGFEVPENGSYKIAINTTDGLFSDPSQPIYLEDTYLSTIYDLRSAPYVFTTGGGTFNDRFVLRYNNTTLSTPDVNTNFGFNIIGVDGYIKVTSGNNPINTVVVYDMLGRVLIDYKNINALDFKVDLPNLSNGTLIVKATLYNGQQKIKKVIY